MSDPQDIPRINPRRRKRSGRGRNWVAIIAAVIFAGGGALQGLANFYTDFLWFGSVDLKSVWSGILFTKIALGAVGVAVFFVLFWANLWVVDRFAPRTLSFNPEDELARRYQQITRPRATLLRTGVSLVLALLAGAGLSTHWNDWLLFINGGNFGVKDPQFHMDIGFFVFKLPFLTTILNWLLYALVLSMIVAVIGHFLQGAIRPQAASGKVTSAVKTHVSILFGLIAIVRAGHYYLHRYQLSYSDRGPVAGANYTDINYLLPALLLLTGISVLAGLMFWVGARRTGWSLPVITVALWGVVSVLVGAIIPMGVQKFSVEPAESKKEAPYIKRNIEATRAAMNLAPVQVSNFSYNNNLTAADLQENVQTIRNVRLWDPDYLRPVYQRLQENRSFFQFNDVDVDRYEINGQMTQVELAVREVNTADLPGGRRSWVNEHLQYTHGYGVVASPSNAVTSNGNPDFTLKDVPPTGFPELKRPQVYFGEHTSPYSIVNTDQAEVDYVASTGNDEVSKYQGKGGVKLDSLVNRAAFAARVGDIKPLISGLISDKSRAMYLTNIRTRAIKAAPFLRFDGDPYPVIADGKILWMQDAYTTSNAYPNAEPADTKQVESSPGGLKSTEFNYVRNSVKVVTDAYDGTMTYYVMDDKDPVIKAWQKAFPKMFTEGSAMPANIRSHVRYPEDLFRVQSEMYGLYHMDNPSDFYSKSDRWNIAQKPEFGASTATTGPVTTPVTNASGQVVDRGETRIEPYYLQMRLPGDADESFLMFQPFVPYSANDQRKELSAFLTAKSDPDDYGKIQAFVMPRDQQINGPALVEAKIQQDSTVKQYITLLNQSESNINLGNMLIIPVKDSLLYVRPLYITAKQTSVPEFKKVIVVHGDKVAMEDTLQGALAKIFGSAPSTQEQARQTTPIDPGIGNGQPAGSTTTTTSPTGTPSSLPPAQVQDLLNQADTEFAAANQALRNGDLAAYQQHLQKVSELIKRAKGG